MASEARAMLDALMGSDRDSSLPVGTDKKSCYDRDICPLYCAWGVDVFDLFTNTKSDFGPNPYIAQEDAREEFLSLPDHEKDRLGYERMLYRKLGELVRGCDRIVVRNKDKLRAEVAKAARARGADGSRIDPVTEVKDELLLETAECMADLELREEEVAEMVEQLVKLDHEWKISWKRLKALRSMKEGDKLDCTNDFPIEKGKIASEKMNGNDLEDLNCDNIGTNNSSEHSTINIEESMKVALKSEEKSEATDEKDGNIEVKCTSEGGEHEANNINNAESEVNCEAQLPIENGQNESRSGDTKDKSKEETDDHTSNSQKIEELMSKLYFVSSEQQKLIANLTSITSQNIMPLRENLQGLQKQLYYIRTDTSSDKTVCEISGNFMSSRDAEERIAAHYAGKQYVGWKMVRDKYRELHQKYNSLGRGPQTMGEQQRGMSYGARGGHSRGYGPPHGGGHGPPASNGNGGGHGPPYGYGDRGPPMGHFHGPSSRYNDRDRSDRSRSRDRDNYSSWGGGGRSGRQGSPSRWERDRYPNSSTSGGNYNREYGNPRYGNKRDERGHNRR